MSEVIKRDYMLKRSQMKGKFKTENYKNRWFQLTATILRYCDGSIENGVGRVKGQILLSDVVAVECTDSDALGNRPNAFQVVYKTGELAELCTLYIIAVYEQQKKDWIDAVRNACAVCSARFNQRYHPGVWQIKGAKYSCCESINKRTEGCQPTTFSLACPKTKENNTLAKVQNNKQKNNESEEEKFGFILALHDYEASDEGELTIKKGEQYELLEKFDAEKWLKVKNKKGKVGLVPASFVKLAGDSEESLEEYEWFYTKTTRSQSENTLQEDGREGCFMVRDSSQKGIFTLSVLKKNNSGEPGTVKHYHIKQETETGHYYLTEKHKFDTIPELIYYHKHNSAGLIVRLRFPPKERMKPLPVPIPDTEEIDPSSLKFGEEVGAGQFGKVHKGIYKGNIEVAIKSLKEDSMSEDDFIDEAKTMVKLNHENLVKLFGVCTKKKKVPTATLR